MRSMRIKPTRPTPPQSLSSSDRIHTKDSLPSAQLSSVPVGYSIDKFVALENYIQTTSVWRVAFVMLVTPIPGLLGALFPSFVPLQDPLAGTRVNIAHHANVFLLCFIIFFGTLLHWRAGAEVPPRVYPFTHIIAVASVTAALQGSFMSLLALTWRFPVPMGWIVASTVTGPCFAVGHLVVFGKRCWQDKVLMDGIKRYVPALVFQSGQIVVYPAFSVLFDRVSSLYQVLLTLAFPIIKYCMKKGLHKYTSQLGDYSSEVAVSGVEICASLYQAMILQSSPSKVALAIIMGADAVQGIVVLKVFMEQSSILPQHQIMHAALDELKQRPGNDENIKALSTTDRLVNLTRVIPSDEGDEKLQVQSAATTTLETANSPVVLHALKLVSVAESILLVEYLEVIIPLINVVFITVSCQFNGAQYNMRLRRLYFDQVALAQALTSIVLYSLLQAASFVAMHVVMRYRYGLSATHHLAFALEHHWQSIVGKMIAWLPIILHFNGVHHGVDFSFRFDFARMLQKKV